jgi:hypothetical protein
METLPMYLRHQKKYLKFVKEVTSPVVPAGHIGVFMGTKILKEYRPRILNHCSNGPLPS